MSNFPHYVAAFTARSEMGKAQPYRIEKIELCKSLQAALQYSFRLSSFHHFAKCTIKGQRAAQVKKQSLKIAVLGFSTLNIAHIYFSEKGKCLKAECCLAWLGISVAGAGTDRF